MTKKNPISAPQNIWSDAQRVDDTDLTLEQNYNNIIESSMINNQFGSGILPDTLVYNVIFDSSLTSGFLDGVPVFSQYQPTDNNFGNQLEIELSGSAAAGKKTVKLCVIGLDFDSNLQYEIFYFRLNEIQISSKHFTKILLLLFNDFLGDPTLSLNLGGRLVISETAALTLSRNPIMLAQQAEPSLFFRDFFVSGYTDLPSLLQSALPLYNTETLNILTVPYATQIISSGDVTTQIGQKFLASTNNIQKITLLLSVQDLATGYTNDLVWNGDIIVSIYPLQSGVVCSSDIAPILAIDFSPSNIPLAQMSINYATLQSAGTALNSIPQPVDFVFSNSPIAGGNVITPGNYYAFTIKRSGAANKCDILIASGSDTVPNSRVTIFNGILWTDLIDQDLWFKIWTDAAKVSDGQFYESGHGAIIPKTIQNSLLATVDYSLNGLQFVGNDIFRAVAATTTNETVPVPDQRTGNPVLTRQQSFPNIRLLGTIDVGNLEQASEPLIIGAISDKNIKFFDSISAAINGTLYSATLVLNELIIRVIDDPTDIVRYNTSVSGLISNLLNGDFVGAQIFPDAGNINNYYRIASATLASSILGDVNGDGIIDEKDLNILNNFVGFDLNVGLPANTTVNTNGAITTFVNGYSTETTGFVDAFGVNFQLVDLNNNVVVSAADGVLVVNPSNTSTAQFTSGTITFSDILGLSTYQLVILSPSVIQNYGGFDIVSIDSSSDVLTIQKIVLNGDVIMQMLRADIDGDFKITLNDGYLLQNYIRRNVLTLSPSSTFPGPSTNPYTKIGTRFNVIRFKLEQFIDRDDDYSSLTIGRPTVVHPSPDIFLSDGYFNGHNFYTSPVSFAIQKQLTWNESLIVTNSQPRTVPTVFTSLSGFNQNICQRQGVNISLYESVPEFDPGLVDLYAPNNVIIGPGGQLHSYDGTFHKVDFEVGTIILEIPDGLFGSERTINILDDFIADYTGDGRTRLGFPSMKFADCSRVTSAALTNDQLRFSVAVQSFSPNTNGTDPNNENGAIVDGKMGVAIDYKTGLLTLNFTNLYQDAVLKTLSTKIQIHVFLKQGGFNNKTIFIDSDKMQNMLQLVSVFSGAVDGGPSALVDLQNDVSGILPIIHGGTGMNGVGLAGMVLASNGSGLSYQFITDLVDTIPFSLGSINAAEIPETDGYGLLDPSFMYKNPGYIYGFSGIISSTNMLAPISISAIGAFSFRFDNYILEGLSSIKLETIISVSNSTNSTQIRLYDLYANNFINLNGGNTQISTNSTTPVLIVSDDIKSLLEPGAIDFIYQIGMNITHNSSSYEATCYMARLVLTYNNPYGAAPPVAYSSNFVPYLPSPTPM